MKLTLSLTCGSETFQFYENSVAAAVYSGTRMSVSLLRDVESSELPGCFRRGLERQQELAADVRRKEFYDVWRIPRDRL